MMHKLRELLKHQTPGRASLSHPQALRDPVSIPKTEEVTFTCWDCNHSWREVLENTILCPVCGSHRVSFRRRTLDAGNDKGSNARGAPSEGCSPMNPGGV